MSDMLLACRPVTEPEAVATALNLVNDSYEFTRPNRYCVDGFARLALRDAVVECGRYRSRFCNARQAKAYRTSKPARVETILATFQVHQRSDLLKGRNE
jgi:hypothetical protein